MSLWIVPILAVLILVLVLSLVRIRIPHDGGKEGVNDYASTLAYDQVSRWPLFSFFRFLTISRLKKYEPNGILVDAGCGPGYLVLDLANNFPDLKIVGVDISAQMLALAQKRLSRIGCDRRVTFQEADVSDLPLGENSIDFVVSTLSLHHWIEPRTTMEEIYRVLKPGGRILIFDLRRDEPFLVYILGNLVQRVFTPPPIQRVNGGIGSIWSSYTPAELRSIISGSPFPRWNVEAGWAWAYIWGEK
jgi:ubiquinone/menaquinone biosynthesis C-methylase UbiE